MKKLVLAISVFTLSGLVLTSIAQQTITLKVIQTGEDGGIPISFDDGEYENDSLDRLNDDDLDMGWEGDDLNVMTCFSRFQNVTIPPGSVINSATMTIYAHEDESAPCNVTVYAEDIDDSPIFAEQEAISDRTWTTASVRWEITEPWTMWQPYVFPDLSPVIQAIIDRPGWASGNALTLFMQGEDQGASLLDNARDLESFENIEDPGDGGDGLWHPERVPTIVIEFTPPAGMVELKVIQTGEDGGIPISFDDGEYENDSIDRLNDDDLDMGWEGDDLNIMTCFTRFQNVAIPQGAIIDSAIMVIYAHEDESAPCNVTIYAEDIDDSPMFAEQEAITDRTWTTASVRWEITEPWTMWHPYIFPDLAPVFQAIVDRPGWVSGNALTLFMQGEDMGASLLDNARDLESFENIEDPGDGGDGLWHPERVPAVTVYFSTGEVSVDQKLQGQSSLISVYPNPADNGMLWVSSELMGPMRVEIFNLTGRLVRVQEQGSHSMMIDVSDLHEGLYLVKTIQPDLIETSKIIIK